MNPIPSRFNRFKSDGHAEQFLGGILDGILGGIHTDEYWEPGGAGSE